MNKYRPVVGLEIHCELKTNSKVFSTAKNSYNEIPNENIKELDLSFPGTMPYLNKEAVRKALKMSMILNCTLPDVIIFDRKNYYYPDLPKGYQITQNQKPVGINGKVNLRVDNKDLEVLIHDIHLEEDTASLDHYDYYSLIDYNRSGVPLIEIVTTPCLHSAKEAVAFLEHLRNCFKYCDISEADTKKGQIRCDVNISLQDEFGNYVTPKVEVKNINSFSYVAQAIEYETKRQTEMVENGNIDKLIQETRRYDDLTNTTIHMRSKVDSVDYKYFVEPNIPRIKLESQWLDSIRKEIPLLPNERMLIYLKEYNLSEYDAGVLVREKEISDYFNECIKLGIDPKTASNWITTQIMGYLNKKNILINEFYLTPSRLFQIINNLDSNKISSKQAKELFFKVIEEQQEPDNLIKKYNMIQISDDNEIKKIILDVLNNSEKQVNEYKTGKTNMFDYFVGQVMKMTKGQANPVLVKTILTEELNK